jgi:hypothetical protein
VTLQSDWGEPLCASIAAYMTVALRRKGAKMRVNYSHLDAMRERSSPP